MKHIFVLFAFGIVLFAFSALASPQYIASRTKTPFHTLTCSWGRKISRINAVYYNTREDAIKDGHRPCKVCKP